MILPLNLNVEGKLERSTLTNMILVSEMTGERMTAAAEINMQDEDGFELHRMQGSRMTSICVRQCTPQSDEHLRSTLFQHRKQLRHFAEIKS